MEKFKYATPIDLNMGYYSIPLDKEAKKLCVISLPWDYTDTKFYDKALSLQPTFSSNA
jgi:hypothetical protein